MQTLYAWTCGERPLEQVKHSEWQHLDIQPVSLAWRSDWTDRSSVSFSSKTVKRLRAISPMKPRPMPPWRTTRHRSVRRYLLDTTPLTGYLQGRPQAVALIGPWLDAHEASTSILVYGEVSEYLMGRSDFTSRDDQLRQLLQEITPFFLSYAVLRRYALIRRQLRPPHGSGLVGDVDTLIADSDYSRIPDLSVMLLDRRTLAPLN